MSAGCIRGGLLRVATARPLLMAWGDFFRKSQKSPASHTGCLLSHVRNGAKEEAPPTQLAAFDIYIRQTALEYTFRGASGPLRDSRTVCESLCC